MTDVSLMDDMANAAFNDKMFADNASARLDWETSPQRTAPHRSAPHAAISSDVLRAANGPLPLSALIIPAFNGRRSSCF